MLRLFSVTEGFDSYAAFFQPGLSSNLYTVPILRADGLGWRDNDSLFRETSCRITLTEQCDRFATDVEVRSLCSLVPRQSLKDTSLKVSGVRSFGVLTNTFEQNANTDCLTWLKYGLSRGNNHHRPLAHS